MNMQVVEFVTYRPEKLWFDMPDRYEFRKDVKHQWLQRLCFWTLRKLGAHARGETVEYKRHAIDTGTFMQRIFEQRNELQISFGHRPTRLLIGAENMAELMRQPFDIHSPLTFNAEYRSSDRGGMQICGLTVEVIPWMRGVLVMP